MGALMDFCNGDESDAIKEPLENVVSPTNKNAPTDSRVPLERDDTENVTEYYNIHQSTTVITMKTETKSLPYALVTDEECNHSDRISVEEYNAQHKSTVQSVVKTRPSRSIVERFSVASKKKNKQRSWMCWSCYPRRRSSTPNTTLGRTSFESRARPTNGAEENDLTLISEKKETMKEPAEKDVGEEAAQSPLISDEKEKAEELSEKDVVAKSGKPTLISEKKENAEVRTEQDEGVDVGNPALICEKKGKVEEQPEKDVAVEAGEPSLTSEEKERVEELAEKDDEGVDVGNPTLICEKKEKVELAEKD